MSSPELVPQSSVSFLIIGGQQVKASGFLAVLFGGCGSAFLLHFEEVWKANKKSSRESEVLSCSLILLFVCF